MFPPQKDSPSTVTVGEISPTDTTVVVQSAEILPQVLPYPLTFGIDKGVTETVLVTAAAQNQLTIQRGYYGQALTWVAGTKVARVLNAADIAALQENAARLRAGIVQETADRVAALSAERNAWQNADETLLDTISDEADRAADAEAALGGDIDALRSDLTELQSSVEASAEPGGLPGIWKIVVDMPTRSVWAYLTGPAGTNQHIQFGRQGKRKGVKRVAWIGLPWKRLVNGVLVPVVNVAIPEGMTRVRLGTIEQLYQPVRVRGKPFDAWTDRRHRANDAIHANRCVYALRVVEWAPGVSKSFKPGKASGESLEIMRFIVSTISSLLIAKVQP